MDSADQIFISNWIQWPVAQVKRAGSIANDAALRESPLSKETYVELLDEHRSTSYQRVPKIPEEMADSSSLSKFQLTRAHQRLLEVTFSRAERSALEASSASAPASKVLARERRSRTKVKKHQKNKARKKRRAAESM